MLLKNYEEQHANVRKEIAVIDSLIKKEDLEQNAFEIATHISRLAGVLKVHLDTEDKYLYPLLEKNSDEKIRNLSTEYQKEMGNLHTEFKVFKEKYNTKQKLLLNSGSFKSDIKKVVHALETRMRKEEQGIYKFIL